MEKIIEPTSLQLEFSSIFPTLMLASSSPNRKALIEAGGTKVLTFKPDILEVRDDRDPIGSVERIVKNKLDVYLSSSSFQPELIAIAADTLVFKDGKLMGKPIDEDDARSMLCFQSGGKQSVLTSIGMYIPNIGNVYFTDSADVNFKVLSDEEIDKYILTGESMGAAGAYRFQKTGYTLLESIDGDWTTVVGLPMRAIIDKYKALV